MITIAVFAYQGAFNLLHVKSPNRVGGGGGDSGGLACQDVMTIIYIEHSVCCRVSQGHNVIECKSLLKQSGRQFQNIVQTVSKAKTSQIKRPKQKAKNVKNRPKMKKKGQFNINKWLSNE